MDGQKRVERPCAEAQHGQRPGVSPGAQEAVSQGTQAQGRVPGGDDRAGPACGTDVCVPSSHGQVRIVSEIRKGQAPSRRRSRQSTSSECTLQATWFHRLFSRKWRKSRMGWLSGASPVQTPSLLLPRGTGRGPSSSWLPSGPHWGYSGALLRLAALQALWVGR